MRIYTQADWHKPTTNFCVRMCVCLSVCLPAVKQNIFLCTAEYSSSWILSNFEIVVLGNFQIFIWQNPCSPHTRLNISMKKTKLKEFHIVMRKWIDDFMFVTGCFFWSFVCMSVVLVCERVFILFNVYIFFLAKKKNMKWKKLWLALVNSIPKCVIMLDFLTWWDWQNERVSASKEWTKKCH